MNILAFLIALFSAILSFLQGGCGTVLSGLGHGLSSEYGSRGDTELFAALGAASFLVVLASFVGLTGGILAIQRKRSAFTVLLVSAGMCGLAFAMSGGSFADGGVWGVLYLASAICARVGYNNTASELTTVLKTPQPSINNINMRILAIIFAVIGILLNLFQMPFRDDVSLAKLLYISVPNLLSGRVRGIHEFLVIVIVPLMLIVLLIIGCIRLMRKKRGKIFLTIPAITYSVIFLLIIIVNANRGPFGRIDISSGIILTWAIFYSLAAICAWLNERKKTLETQITQQDTDNQNIRPAVTLSKKEVTGSVPQETYEPVVGVETDALIKRAFLFLEDGEIYEAERYIEQALNQDPENPQVYMAKLMLEHRVKSPIELLSKLSTPLENEKLFQRALRFADGEYKSQLEGLVQSNRNKLEQERMRREKEEAEERVHQNGLMLEKKEKYYQEAILDWQKAKTPDEIQAVINRLEKLNGYKDVDELLSDAREDLAEAKKRKLTKGISLTVALIALIWGGIAFVGSYHDAKRREEAQLAEQAQLQREQEIQSTYAEAEEYFKARNYSSAFEKYQILANQGYAPAQHKLGWLYQNGWGTQRDYSQAMQWYSRAADQGHAGAQSGIGMLYEEGLGVTKDLQEALRWYKISASNGSKSAPGHVSLVERMIFNENTRDTLIMNRNDIPLPATIFGNKVNLRTSPRTKAKSVKQLNAGHPVSISKLSDENDGMWCLVKTASGSEGWVKSDYLTLSNNINRTDQERSNRKYNLPANGVVANILTPGDMLNIRNIPSLNAPKVLAQIELGEQVQVLEIFAESERDWYRIRCETMIYLPEEETDYDVEIEGWVNGRYINIR